MGPQAVLAVYPRLVLLVGANVDGKPNFMAVGASCIANREPAMMAIAILHQQYTHRGILQNMTFSINIPSVDLVKETDYCGIVSGSKADKVKVCQFKVFYGKLGNAPLIEQCPVNMECKVVHVLDLGSHTLFVGRIEEIHVSDDCLADGEPVGAKIKPLLYVRDRARQYVSTGTGLAQAFSAGLELKNKDNS